MGTRISQLPVVAATSDADTMVVVQGGITSQVQVDDFIDLVETAYDSKIAEYDGLFANLSWVRDFVYPVGAQYVQYAESASNDPAVSLPAAHSPATLFGGTWDALWEDESVAFITQGTLANDGRTNGLQADALQGHRHEIDTRNASSSGIQGFQYALGNAQNTPDPTYTFAADLITDGTNGTPRTASVTRVRNRLCILWIRTA